MEIKHLPNPRGNPNMRKGAPSVNPAGRPMGSRQRISEVLLPLFGELLEEDQARVALRTMRDNEPGKFFTIAAGLLPKQLEAMVTAQTSSGGFTPEERHAIRGVLDAIEAAGAQGIEPAQCFELITHALRAELAKPVQIDALPVLAAPPPL